jgi:hypothetical protein
MLNEDVEALIVASHFRKKYRQRIEQFREISAPPIIWRRQWKITVRDGVERIREDREPKALCLAFKKADCGTTPSFWSTTSRFCDDFQFRSVAWARRKTRCGFCDFE